MKNQTSLEARIEKVAKANTNGRTIRTDEHSFGELFKVQNDIIDLYKNKIKKNGIAFKIEMMDPTHDELKKNNISLMPYGHAIISEVRETLSMIFFTTSNAYSK